MAELPRAIQAELDEADRLMKNAEAPDPGNTPEPDPTPPSPAPQPVPASQDPAPVVADPEGDAYRRRYETLQGKYNAEVPRLQQQLREVSGGYVQLQQELQRLKERPAAPPAKPEPDLVTSRDEEKFGSDLIDMARRVAQEELRAVQQRFASVEAAVGRLAPKVERVNQVEQNVEAARVSAFYGELKREVPDYEAVNADQRWLAWLAEFDPIAGKTRQACLDEAAASFDSVRVAAMFKAFRASVPAAPDPDKGRSELARQVAPSRSSTVAQTPPGKRVFSGVDYVYWTDPRRMHDKPRKEVESMLVELELAVAEGRVKW